MSNYLIVGCGHFGSLAVQKLLKKDPHSKITVIDRDERALHRSPSFPIETVIGEAIAILSRSLSRDRNTYIIPAVPFHLAFEFVLSKLRPLGAKRTQVPNLSGLPNPMMGETGNLYTSHADFFCPEDCPEPSFHCTVTRRKRPESLYKKLEALIGPFESKVIRSRQLGPGVGGFRSEVLFDLIEDIRQRRASRRTLLISTACRCHGVTSALSV
jgi:hypothetical protein